MFLCFINYIDVPYLFVWMFESYVYGTRNDNCSRALKDTPTYMQSSNFSCLSIHIFEIRNDFFQKPTLEGLHSYFVILT